MAEMKAIYRTILIGAAMGAGVLSLTSCDDVKSDDRYIEVGEITPVRSVILEDFTGQMCVNCPDAHEVIENLEKQYGDYLIPVSIHCGEFGRSTNWTNFARNRVGLMTEEGNAIMEAYGIQSFPMGTVDFGSPITYDQWSTAVRNALQIYTNVQVELEARYVPGPADGGDAPYTGNIEIKAVVESGSDRTANVQFWILEDGIVAVQSNHGTAVTDYVHNNVFRAQVFDGLYGQSFSFDANESKKIDGSIATRWTEKEHWEINNLSVVAIVSDKSGVLQAKKVKLVENGEE